MRKSLLWDMLAFVLALAFAAPDAAAGDTSIGLVMNSGVTGTSFAWVNESAGINWPNPEITDVRGAELRFQGKSSRWAFGLFVEALDIRSLEVEGPYAGPGRKFLRTADLDTAGVTVTYHFTRGRVQPFLAGNTGVIRFTRHYEERTLDDKALKSYSKEPIWGGSFWPEAGASVYFVPRHLMLKGSVTYNAAKVVNGDFGYRFGVGLFF